MRCFAPPPPQGCTGRLGLRHWRRRCGRSPPLLGPHPGGPVSPGHASQHAGGAGRHVSEVSETGGRSDTKILSLIAASYVLIRVCHVNCVAAPSSTFNSTLFIKCLFISLHYQLFLPAGSPPFITSVEMRGDGVQGGGLRGQTGADGRIGGRGAGEVNARYVG